MPDDIKNVFISHVHEDDAGLQKTKDLLAGKGIQIRDSSVNSSTPNKAKSREYIMNGILKPRIDWAGTMLVYITPKTKESEWVQREIEYAAKQGKRIVGVWAHGHSGCEMPDAVKKYADAVVGWQAERIIDAIDGKVDGFENPDGTPSEPLPIKRHPC